MVVVGILLFLIQDFAALFASPDFLSIGQHFMRNTGGFLTFAANDLEVRDGHRGLLLEDPTLGHLLGRPSVTLDHIDLLDQGFLSLGEEPDDPSFFSTIFPSQDEDRILAMNMHGLQNLRR
jgi:hypothetical protein